MEYNKGLFFRSKLTRKAVISSLLWECGAGTKSSSQGKGTSPYICIYGIQDHTQSKPASQRSLAAGVPIAANIMSYVIYSLIYHYMFLWSNFLYRPNSTPSFSSDFPLLPPPFPFPFTSFFSSFHTSSSSSCSSFSYHFIELLRF